MNKTDRAAWWLFGLTLVVGWGVYLFASPSAEPPRGDTDTQHAILQESPEESRFEWNLILTLIPSLSGGGSSITVVSGFSSRIRCKVAGNLWLKQQDPSRDRFSPRALCVISKSNEII